MFSFISNIFTKIVKCISERAPFPSVSPGIILVITCLIFQACNNDDILDRLDLPVDIIFTHLPTDLSQMQEFAPIGQMRVIPKVHGGYLVKNPFQTNATTPVYAMSDGIIINIQKESRVISDHGAPTAMQGMEYYDFQMDIALTKTARIYYGHITELSENVKQKAGNLREGRGRDNRVTIDIKAGEVLGYIGLIPGLDIGMYDLNRENFFANPARYSKEYRSTVSYTDYCNANLRNQIWAINPRTVEPRGGTIAHDVEGTLAGNWFLENTQSLHQWSRQLVFGKHDRHGDKITIVDASPLADGDGIQNDGRDSYVWWVMHNDPDPATINPSSGKIKYAVAKWFQFFHTTTEYDGTVMIEMISNTRLKYQFFEDMTPEMITDFSSEARIYER